MVQPLGCQPVTEEPLQEVTRRIIERSTQRVDPFIHEVLSKGRALYDRKRLSE